MIASSVTKTCIRRGTDQIPRKCQVVLAGESTDRPRHQGDLRILIRTIAAGWCLKTPVEDNNRSVFPEQVTDEDTVEDNNRSVFPECFLSVS
jgi:hypothetical protein